MATLNKHIFVLAVILSDISDGSDTNFIYILSANKCQQRNYEKHFETNKTLNEITHKPPLKYPVYATGRLKCHQVENWANTIHPHNNA